MGKENITKQKSEGNKLKRGRGNVKMEMDKMENGKVTNLKWK